MQSWLSEGWAQRLSGPGTLKAGNLASALRYPDFVRIRVCSRSRCIYSCAKSREKESLIRHILSPHERNLPLYLRCSSNLTLVWNCVKHIGHMPSCGAIYICKGWIHACALNICSCNCCLVDVVNKQEEHLKDVLTILVSTFLSIICCGTYRKTVNSIIYIIRAAIRNCCGYCLI